MKHKLLMAITAGTLALGGLASQAEALTFRAPNGTTFNFNVFDDSPGNTVALDAVPLVQQPATQNFDLVYQATLGNFMQNSTVITANGGLNSTYSISTVLGFTENGSITNAAPPTNANFSFVPSNFNYFRMYLDPTPSQNIQTGMGFTPATNPDLVLLMSGSITGSTGSFFVSSTNNAGPLDQSPNAINNLPGVTTVGGIGGTDLTAKILITSINGAYFLDAPGILTMDLAFNTVTQAPFRQVDPSKQVFVDGIGMYSPDYGAGNVNGIPNADPTDPADFHFQSDSNASVVITAVPEPSTMLLTGLGLAALAGSVIRRKKS
ncbi:MAG: PEP-CTERM sorting domain-containing protein [Desulfuromonadales bacterium]|nr:MAG: PEP-CTERM sorting domain-containing protein [Desulfuromonadales bacterium]RNC67964.1 MAG: PEP-CTERM sorting domain-containing protein [Desulfuromonadales bacterium]